MSGRLSKGDEEHSACYLPCSSHHVPLVGEVPGCPGKDICQQDFKNDYVRSLYSLHLYLRNGYMYANIALSRWEGDNSCQEKANLKAKKVKQKVIIVLS